MFFLDAGQSLLLERKKRSLNVWGIFSPLLAVVRSPVTWVSLSLLLVLSFSIGGVVYSSHLTRQLYAELATLTDQRDFYQAEWSQLLLEESALSSHGRVERVAKDKLNMVMPEGESVIIVR